MSHRARSKRSPILTALAAAVLAGVVLSSLPASAELGLFAAPGLSSERGRSFVQADDGRIEGVRMADADCSAAAAEAAAQTGGQVLSVSSRDDGGRTVCVVTVLVPGEDGERPRKRTLTLPQ